MPRLSDELHSAVYAKVSDCAKEYTDDKYPCGNGGWIHYRVKLSKI